MNLKFLEVQLHAVFDEWKSIIEMTSFMELCQARKSPVILNYLLQAILEVYVTTGVPLSQQVENYVSDFEDIPKLCLVMRTFLTYTRKTHLAFARSISISQ